jgi:hypothetical protein
MTAHLLAHTNLLAPFDGTGRYHPLDAVIVPAGRPAEHTRAAAAIAHMTDAELLVLCSQKAEPVAVARVVAEEHVARSHVVGVPADYQSGLLPSPPPTIQAEQASRPDLSRKRNLGLAVARMAGWRTVLLVDDDITLDVGDVVAAQYALDATPAVGFPIEDWPDNSAIGHANRMSGGAQEVFVGPSALLVDVEAASLGQFPTIYNEGSLFLFDAVAERKVSRSPGRARQLPYNPFRDLDRGGDEEFGDVIFEGLMGFLHAPSTAFPTGPSYWREFLPRRRAFLTGVADRLRDSPPSPRHVSALCAVHSAMRRHAAITPAACARFIRHWRAERRLWVRRLAQLDQLHTVPQALERLGLEAVSPRPRSRPRLGPSALEPVATVEAPAVIAPRVKTAPGSDVLAVLIPGFLDSEKWAGTRSLAENLRRSGRTAVSFDPRGTFSTPGSLDQIRPSVQIRDAISAIGMVRPHARTVLIGHSLGASIAVFAADDPRVTDVVAIMPPRCFVWPHEYDAARDTWRGARRFVVSPQGSSVKWQFKVPHSVVDDAVTHDLPATLRAMRRDQRILFIAGTADTVIPEHVVKGLHDECNAQKTFLPLPVGHDYRDHPDQLRLVNDAVLTWIAAGDAQPVAPPDQRGRSAAVG